MSHVTRMEKSALQKYRAALIGCSRIGGFIDNEIPPREQIAYPLPYSHAACYEACERTDLVACCDLRQDIMSEFGKRSQLWSLRFSSDEQGSARQQNFAVRKTYRWV